MEASRKVDIAERLAALLARLSASDRAVVLAYGEGMAYKAEQMAAQLAARQDTNNDGQRAG